MAELLLVWGYILETLGDDDEQELVLKIKRPFCSLLRRGRLIFVFVKIIITGESQDKNPRDENMYAQLVASGLATSC